MEAMMKKFFDQKLGEFVQVDKDDVQFNFSGGSTKIRLAKASFKESVFDQLHFPIALRGGFIEEMSINLDMGVFSSSPAQIKIKNVFLVFGPHTSDWSWQHVYDCKSKLVDLVMKIWELKSSKKKNKPTQGGYFSEMVKRRIEDIEKKFLGNLEVHISNIHIRYEDAITQPATPFASGFKIGFIGVTSEADPKSLRTTGEWKYSKERCGEPFVSQSIKTRRISAYWDVGHQHKLITAKGPVTGTEVCDNFKRLNIRETFSACVVDEILTLFPTDHPRRKYLEGPSFRERLDFHRYVVFPSSLNAHVMANRVDENTRLQKAPLKDADVIFDPLQVAVDSEQVRSINELLAYTKDFQRKDDLFRTRPQRAISSLPGFNAGRTASSSSRPPFSPTEQRERQTVLKAWWHHALEGVRLMCNIPRSQLNAEELKKKAELRKEYVELCLASADEKQKAKEAGQGQDAAPQPLPSAEKLREMQMKLPLREILDWRLLARDRSQEQKGQPAPQEEEPKDEDEDESAKEPDTKMSQGPPVDKPNTLQVRVQFKAFQAYFLIVADQHWRTAMQFPNTPPGVGEEIKISARYRGALTRQLVVKGQVSDVRVQLIQKGRSNHRVARWLQLEIGRISASNCNTKTSKSAARDILNIAPFEHQPGVVPVSVFVGATTFEMKDKNFEPGDVPMAAVLEPWAGLVSHAKEYPPDSGTEADQLRRLGFRDIKDEPGRLMTFAFVRMGQVQALDYTPFRRRLLHFIKRGNTMKPTYLVRRPSPLALDRELLVKLQRRVEKLTGKSNMLGSVEGILDGVQGRLVDHYNSQNVLCKQVALAPMRWKALRTGTPQTFNLQFHQLLKPGEQQPLMPRLSGDMFGMLPWKVAMMLQPKAEYTMGLDGYPDPAHGKAPTMAAPDMAAAVAKSSTAPAPRDLSDATTVRSGAYFIKWCRNGKPKKRFITYDEQHDAIVWKNTEKNGSILGLIPLAKIQDICTGAKTPVLFKARGSPKFREDRAWSIIAADRTLDLQAESVAQQHSWVTGLEARFKLHVQQYDFDGKVKEPLPPKLERQQKTYPDKFRSDQCGLRSKLKKLQAFQAVNNVTGEKSL